MIKPLGCYSFLLLAVLCTEISVWIYIFLGALYCIDLYVLIFYVSISNSFMGGVHGFQLLSCDFSANKHEVLSCLIFLIISSMVYSWGWCEIVCNYKPATSRCLQEVRGEWRDIPCNWFYFCCPRYYPPCWRQDHRRYAFLSSMFTTCC